jgi:hypothetical protein
MLNQKESDVTQMRSKKRKLQRDMTNDPVNPWRAIDFSRESFKVDETHITQPNALLTFRKTGKRGAKVELVDIFRRFVNKDLYDSIYRELSPDSFYIAADHSFTPNKKGFYKSLAIQIKIMGTGYAVHQWKLDVAISSERDYFINKFPSDPPCGQQITKCYVSRFLIGPNSLDILSKNFLSIISRHGQYLVGDEKLFRFRGKGAPLVYEPKKPDVIGLWFYELVCLLRPNLPYCVHIRMYHKETKNEVIPMTSIVGDWINSINAKYSQHNPILCFDSHYMSKDVVSLLIRRKILFVGASNANKSYDLYNLCAPHVQDPGDKVGYHNESTNQTFILYHAGHGLGKRCVLSNAHICDQNVPTALDEVPVYTTYKTMFSGCDVFNSHLSNRVWPYSRGGHGTKGGFGHCHSFNLAVILRNTFNVYAYLNEIDKDDANKYRQLCYELADQLYAYALTIN